MHQYRQITIAFIAGAIIMAFLTTGNVGPIAVAQQRSAQRWQYATLGRVPLGTDLQFQCPQITVTSDTVEGLSQKLGGRPQRNLAILMETIGSQGWELVAVAPDSVAQGDFATCYFKRPAQ